MLTDNISLLENEHIELDESDMNPFDLNTVEDVIDLVEKYGGTNNEKKYIRPGRI